MKRVQICQCTHQDLHRFVPVTHGHVCGDLFVAADTESSHSVAGLREHRLLAGELLKNFGSLGKAVAGFTDGDVQHQLVDAHLPHGIFLLFGLYKNGERMLSVSEGEDAGSPENDLMPRPSLAGRVLETESSTGSEHLK